MSTLLAAVGLFVLVAAAATAVVWARREPAAIAPPQPSRGRTEAGPLVEGWIRTEARTIDGLPACLEAHTALTAQVHPLAIEVTLAELPDGAVAIGFPEGVPAYELANLVGWIDDGSGRTAGFLTAPDTAVRFGLVPDPDNASGDTLRGTGSDGACVEVHLPDGAVHPIPWAAPVPEPSPADAVERARFRLTVDANAAFGNPHFRITGTPPPVPVRERGAVEAALWTLSQAPEELEEASLGTLHAVDADAMDRSPDELEAAHEGTLRFATTPWHDQWLLVRPDGRWVEVQEEDGIVATHPDAAHLAADLLVRASEEAVDDDDLRWLARRLGLPADAADWVRQGGAGDYDTWRQNVVERVAAAVS